MVLPALKESDPGRYGALHHPGDAFSFDIFSQAARAVRAGGVLGPLPVECLLATGQSQSAIHLVSYVNAVAPTVPPEAACDGYLIGSRTGFAAPLTGWDGRIRAEGPDSKLAAAIGPDVKGKLSAVFYTVAIGCAFVEHWISTAIYVAVALMWLVPDRRIESMFKE